VVLVAVAVAVGEEADEAEAAQRPEHHPGRDTAR